MINTSTHIISFDELVKLFCVYKSSVFIDNIFVEQQEFLNQQDRAAYSQWFRLLLSYRGTTAKYLVC